MLFLKSEYLIINYYPNERLVETCWLGFVPSKEYRKALESYLEVLRQHQVERWLGDYRLARAIRQKDQEWVSLEWFPRFLTLANGIVRMARVNSQDLFSRLSTENIQKKMDVERMPFLYQEFDDYIRAKCWVLQE